MSTVIHECTCCENYTTIWPFTFNNHIKTCTKLPVEFSCNNNLEAYECKKCNFETSFKVVYNSHFNLKDCRFEGGNKQDEELVCDGCTFSSFSKYSFELHKSSVTCWSVKTKDEKLKCKVCSKILNTKNGFRQHMHRMHLNFLNLKTIHQCHHCPYNSSRLGDLKYHIVNKHTDPDQIRWFKCTQCSYQSKHKFTLNNHIHTCHSERSEELLCRQCSYKTTKKYDLMKHINSIHSENFVLHHCNYCSYETRYKNCLKTHIIFNHSDPKKLKWFLCEICSYKAKLKGTLSAHIKTVHTPDWNKCEHCTFKTKDEAKFKKHIKQHALLNNEIIYCGECSYQTHRKRNLASHFYRMHTDQWHTCEHCEYRTRDRNSLNRHYIWRHANPESVTWYECADCSYKSKFKKGLREHMFRRHKKPK